MHYFESTTISGHVFLHQVGNKCNDEPLVISRKPLDLTDYIKIDLKQYFLSHFKQSEYFALAMKHLFRSMRFIVMFLLFLTD